MNKTFTGGTPPRLKTDRPVRAGPATPPTDPIRVSLTIAPEDVADVLDGRITEKVRTQLCVAIAKAQAEARHPRPAYIGVCQSAEEFTAVYGDDATGPNCTCVMHCVPRCAAPGCKGAG